MLEESRPAVMRSPDTSWIQSSRWNKLSPQQQASFAPIAPDFVIELRSSSDTLLGLQEKMQEYGEQGVRLGSLIDDLRSVRDLGGHYRQPI
jgi:Uma2 family endonuclease